eukprot:UN3735
MSRPLASAAVSRRVRRQALHSKEQPGDMCTIGGLHMMRRNACCPVPGSLFNSTTTRHLRADPNSPRKARARPRAQARRPKRPRKSANQHPSWLT